MSRTDSLVDGDHELRGGLHPWRVRFFPRRNCASASPPRAPR